MKTLQDLLNTLPQQGELRWIGLRPERRADMLSVESAVLSTANGLEGDRYKGRTGQRHVTLLQEEHLTVIAGCSGRDQVKPEDLRRNLLVRGINLLALKNRIITVGDIELEITGLCHPCSRMEETLGAGGYNAVRGHGGVTARVLTDGQIRVGDVVALGVQKELDTKTPHG